MSITQLWAYGCSFTGGSELMDHVLSQDAESIKLQHGHRYWLEQHRSTLTQQQFEQQEKQQVWAAEIARRHSLEYHNHARNGSGMAEIVDTVEKHWHQGALDDPQILIVVGITVSTRLMTWRHGVMETIFLSDLPDHWHQPTVIDFCSDEWLTHQHLGHLLRLVQISNCLNGRLKMFDMMGITQDLVHIQTPRHSFHSRWQEIRQSGHAHFDLSLMDTMKRGEQHGGSHPTVAVHQRFARWSGHQLKKWLPSQNLS